MADSTLTPSDVALLQDRGDGMWGGSGSAFFWIFALLILAGGNFGFGGNNGNFVTQSELTNQLNAQTTNAQLQTLAVETANNNYETAQLINEQTNQMLQQNNTNLINAIQGFNNLGLQITNQTNVLAQQISELSHHLDSCCCEIKTQMLQNRLDDANAALVAAQNNISNANQSQYILGQLGRFVAWTPSGTQAVSGS